jgi:hypothetical protein
MDDSFKSIFWTVEALMGDEQPELIMIGAAVVPRDGENDG